MCSLKQTLSVIFFLKPKHAVTLLVCVYSHSTDKKCVITLLVCVYSHSADRKCAITLLVCVYHTALIKSVIMFWCMLAIAFTAWWLVESGFKVGFF